MCKHCAIACKRYEASMGLVSMESPRTQWILEGGDDYYFVTKVERELIEMVEKEKEQKTMLKRLQGLSHRR